MGVAFSHADALPTMKHPILQSAALLLLVWTSAATDAKAPYTPVLRSTTPPDFYQVIVTNNLFRPLGWTPPKPPQAFELIATVMKSNGRHKALLRNTGDRKVYYAVVGEVVGGAIVEKIEARRVTLNRDGTSETLRLSLFDDGGGGENGTTSNALPRNWRF